MAVCNCLQTGRQRRCQVMTWQAIMILRGWRMAGQQAGAAGLAGRCGAHFGQYLLAMLCAACVINVMAEQRIHPGIGIGPVVGGGRIAHWQEHEPQGHQLVAGGDIWHAEVTGMRDNLRAQLFIEAQASAARTIRAVIGHFNFPKYHIGAAFSGQALAHVVKEALANAAALMHAIDGKVWDKSDTRIAQKLHPHHGDDVVAVVIAGHQQPQGGVVYAIVQSLKRDFFLRGEVGLVDVADKCQVFTAGFV